MINNFWTTQVQCINHFRNWFLDAQVLCDRLGIFVEGRLVCVGAPKEIASRYGKYLVRRYTA